MKRVRRFWLLWMLVACVAWPAVAQSVNARNLLKVARSYAGQGDWAKAKDYADQALKQEPGYLDALYMRAYAHRELEEYAKAEEDFREVIRREPTFLGTYGALAEMYVKQKLPDKAEILFNQMSAQPDGGKWADYYRGVLAYNKPDLTAAEQHWLKVLSVDTNFAPALHNLGALYLAQGQPGKALVKFQGALHQDSEKPLYRMHVGWALERLGRYEEAKEILGKVMNENRDDTLNLQLATALNALITKRPQVALTNLKGAADDNPDNADVFILLGRTYLALGQPKEAREAYAKAHELDPASKEVEEELKKLPTEAAPASAPGPSTEAPAPTPSPANKAAPVPAPSGETKP